MFRKLPILLPLGAALLFAGCQDHRIPVSTSSPVIAPLASGFVAPLAVETDATGRIFVSEHGTGQNDGRISEVTPDGKVYPVITGLYSVKLSNGDLDAPDHMLAANGVLYILTPKGLITLNLDTYKTGNPAIPAASLTPENIQQFVINYNFTNDTGESHLYGLTLGPDGAIYIADAAANAIIRRSPSGQLSVVAEVPGTANPNPAGPPPGPPVVESVPTGIIYDGKQFAISTLLGFPFPAGKALIYRMDLNGKITTYQQTFTSLVDIENDGNGNYLALEFATFGPTDFTPKTGRLLRARGTASDILLDNLNFPTDLKVVDAHTAYLVSLVDGTLSKIAY